MRTIPRSCAPLPARSSVCHSWRDGRSWTRWTSCGAPAGPVTAPAPPVAAVPTRSTSPHPPRCCSATKPVVSGPRSGHELDGWITIPMAAPAESLNVAMAAHRRVLRGGAPTGRRRWRTMTLAELEAILSDADPDVFALAGVESLDALAAAERALVGRGSPMSRGEAVDQGPRPVGAPSRGQGGRGVHRARR